MSDSIMTQKSLYKECKLSSIRYLKTKPSKLKILGYDNIGRAGSIPARGTISQYPLYSKYLSSIVTLSHQFSKKSLKEPIGVLTDSSVTHQSKFINSRTTKGRSVGTTKCIYRITVTNWSKYNSNIKRGHKATLISNNFCTDPKLLTLPLSMRWAFLGILLICGDATSETVEVNFKTIRELLDSKLKVSLALDSLEQLQLLTYEKIEPLINRIEKNRIERNRKEYRRVKEKKDAPQPPLQAAPVVEISSPAIALYCDEWKSRYKSQKHPAILPQHAKQIKTLVTQVGLERAKEFIKTYFQMPDSWFVTKRHDIPTLMGNLNSITHFMETGRLVTKSDLKTLETKSNTQNLLKLIDEGKI